MKSIKPAFGCIPMVDSKDKGHYRESGVGLASRM